MDSIVWQTYDTFSGSSLNTTLWTVDKMNGTLSTGTGGLRLTPTPLSGGVNKNNVSIDATLVINQGAFFAAQVPFSIATGVPGSGGAVHFAIELDDGDINWNNIGLGNGNNFNLSGTIYNGTFFRSGTNANPLETTQNTSVTQGELGLIYSGNMIIMYYNDGTGWHQLGTPNSTAGLTGPLDFSLEAQINGSGSLTAVVPYVQFSTVAPVPLPSAMLLFGPGLFGLATLRRSFTK
jgi:hypothetical protein